MFTIQLKDITKTYQVGEIKVDALRGVSIDIGRGEFVAVMGASGSGKSTLMNLIGCLDRPSGGEYLLDGAYVHDLSRNELADIRNQKIGFVFQGFNLLPRTTALENVELPLLYDRTCRIKDTRSRAAETLKVVGLEDRMDHEPNQLSGGQQQRVAIARALVNQPSIILADEPTGNLDSHTAVEVLSMFQDLNERGITVVLVTHEADLALYAKRVITLRDGAVMRDEPVSMRRNAGEDLAALKVGGDDPSQFIAGRQGLGS